MAKVIREHEASIFTTCPEYQAASDVGELSGDIEWVLRTFSDQFATIVWTPGNHELWTHLRDPVQLRGEERYRYLVDLCRFFGVLTPEDPYPSREAWYWARIEATEQRLATLHTALPVIFVNHYPLVREPARGLRYPQFAQWCGTTRTADWHVRFNAVAMVYGHLRIPRVTWHGGVRFVEVSVGYPREWQRRSRPAGGQRQILPLPEAESASR